MSKSSKLDTKKNETKAKKTAATTATVGRKRDDSLDASIIEAALTILADVGFDRMTMDLVAAKAKTGKASMYRRWSSKTELVRDALVHMNKSSVALGEPPDTGSLREDLLALVKPKSAEQSEKKMRVLSGLGSFFAEYRKVSEDISAQIFGGWEAANAELFARAMERGEIAKSADIEGACKVISAMTAYTTTLLVQTFDKTSYAELLDNILLPALRAGTRPAKAKR